MLSYLNVAIAGKIPFRSRVMQLYYASLKKWTLEQHPAIKLPL